MPVLGVVASSISNWLDASAYFPIATTTLTTATASVTFSSIPATYTHLQIRTMCLTSASATDVKAQFNGDTGSNYALHLLWGNGSAASAGAYTAQTYAVAGITSITTANPASGVIDILDYANTNKNTTVRTLSGSDTNGVGGFIFLESGLWLNTNGATAYYPSAITIDGNAVTPKVPAAITAGNASAIDAYSFTIIKTASATFTVLETQTKFA